MRDLKSYIKIILEQDSPIRFLTSRLLRWTGIWRFIKIKQDGYILLLQPSSISLALWINPNARSEDVDVIKKILRPGDSFYDIGANIGQISIEAALLVGASGAVTSFEAHPRTAQLLRNNVELNGLQNIRIVQAAVGEKCGWVSFTDEKSDDQNGVSDNGEICVPMLNLDVLTDGEKIDLLKIDIEGYELSAIKGASQIIKSVDFIYFEAWDAHFKKYGYSFFDLHEHLSEMGFIVGRINMERNRVTILRKSDTIPNCENLLAWRDSSYLAERTGLAIFRAE